MSWWNALTNTSSIESGGADSKSAGAADPQPTGGDHSHPHGRTPPSTSEPSHAH